MTDPSTPADLGRDGDDVQRSRDRPLCQPTEKGPAEPYIRSARPRAKPISHMLGKEEAGLDGTNLLAGIEAMNGPGHTSIPVRRTQSFSEPPRPTNSLRHLELRSFWHDAGLEIAPEGDNQLARQSHQRDPTHAARHRADTGAVPTGQSAARLMP